MNRSGRERHPVRGGTYSPRSEEQAPDPVLAALSAVEPDNLAPREALEILYALKRLQAEGGSR